MLGSEEVARMLPGPCPAKPDFQVPTEWLWTWLLPCHPKPQGGDEQSDLIVSGKMREGLCTVRAQQREGEDHVGQPWVAE